MAFVETEMWGCGTEQAKFRVTQVNVV